MGEQARDTVLLTTQTIAEENNRQLKSSALQQMLDRVHSVMNEWKKIDQNEFLNKNSKNFARYSAAMAEVLKEIAGYIDTLPPLAGKVLSQGLKISGDTFELMNMASGAAWEAKIKQGTTALDGAVHQGADAFGKLRPTDFKTCFNITVLEAWDQDNVESDYLIIKSPNGDEAHIDKDQVRNYTRALSRLESIKGDKVTQQEAFDLAAGDLELRQFEAGEEHFAIDLATGRQATAVVDIADLAGKFGEEQEFDAGRFYQRSNLLSQAMAGIKTYEKKDGSYRQFEDLNAFDQMALIRQHNRLNDMYRLSGRDGEIPANVMGKHMQEELVLKNADSKEFSTTETILVDDMMARLDDPATSEADRADIMVLIQAELTRVGIATPQALQKANTTVQKAQVASADDPASMEATPPAWAPLSEPQTADDAGGFGEIGQEQVRVVQKRNSGKSAPGEFAEINDPETLQAIRDSNEARRKSREGEISFSYHNWNKNAMWTQQNSRKSQQDGQEMVDILSGMLKGLTEIQRQGYERQQQAARERELARNASRLGLDKNPYQKYEKWAQEAKRQKEAREKEALRRAQLEQERIRQQQASSSPPDSGTPSSGNIYNNPATGQTGRSYDECVAIYCPVCSQSISLLGESLDSRCTDCKKNKAGLIQKCVSGSGSASLSFTGSMSRNYYAARKYQPRLNNYLYVIGKSQSGSVSGYDLLYGPDTYLACEQWLKTKGYW